MFNQMLGAGDIDPVIVKPKYNVIRQRVKSTIKILSACADDVFSKFEQEEECKDIKKYIKDLESIEFKEDFESKEELGKAYLSIKGNHVIKTMIITCKNLITYKDKLSSGDDFDDSFISRIPGFDFCPFPFSQYNIKRMWSSSNIDDRIKKYTFTVLRLILSNCKDVYEILTSPDVDVKEFSKVIIASISDVKKAIPRCEQAFSKIEESVSLLEGNFNGYYKDFIQSQNPSTIIESFVIDVSNTGNTDIQTTRQFRKIIDYYRKATQGKIKDPKIKKVFDMLNSNFNTMESEVMKKGKGSENKDELDENKDDIKNEFDTGEADSMVMPFSEEVPEETEKVEKPLTGKQRRALKREQTKKNENVE
jgi:hypothetical protein